MHDIDFTLPPDTRAEQARSLLEADSLTRAAHVIGQRPGLAKEKNQLAAQIALESPDFLPLVRHLPAERLDAIVKECVDQAQYAELLLEIARHYPAVVRPFADQLEDPQLMAALRAEAPDSWVEHLHAAYTRERNVAYIRSMGQVRTDRACSSLIRASKDAPQEHLEAFQLALENCGVFPDTRLSSIYSDAFRAYVVSCVESPHRMGPNTPFDVPLCLFCQTPAERLLSLDASALGEDYELECNPSFFGTVATVIMGAIS